MKNKRRLFLGVIILGIALIVGGLLYYFSHQGKQCEYGTYKLYDNVKVVSQDSDIQIQSIKEGTMCFTGKTNLRRNDVIVSGVSNAAPDGGIWILEEKPQKVGQYYQVKVTYGTLLDVFEEANINATFDIYDDGSIVEKQDANNVLEEAFSLNDVHAEGMETTHSREIGKAFTREVTEYSTFSGEVKYKLSLNFIMMIEDGNIELELTLTNQLTSELKLECKASSEKEFEEDLINKQLKPIEFQIGTIPVVISQEVGVTIEANYKVEGDICNSVGLSKTNTIGFNYSSKTGKVREILNDRYDSDGLNLQVTTSVSAQCSAEASLYYQAKLYGVLGIEVSPGIEGNVQGTLNYSITSENGKGGLEGTADAQVMPVVKGTVIVDNPIVGKNLLTQELFKKEFKPLWEKHWKSSKTSKEDDMDEYKKYVEQDNYLVGKEYSAYLVRRDNQNGYNVDYVGDPFYNGIVAYTMEDMNYDGKKEFICVRSKENGTLSLSLEKFDQKAKKLVAEQAVELHPIATDANICLAQWSIIGEHEKYILYNYYIAYSAVSDFYYRGVALYKLEQNKIVEVAKYNSAGSDGYTYEEDPEYDKEVQKVFQAAGKQAWGEDLDGLKEASNYLDYIDGKKFGEISTTEMINGDDILLWEEEVREPAKLRVAIGYIY